MFPEASPARVSKLQWIGGSSSPKRALRVAGSLEPSWSPAHDQPHARGFIFIRIICNCEGFFLTDNLTHAVFGAGGKTGTLLLEQAKRRGHHVRGLEHHLPDPAKRIEGVDYIQCDVLEDDLADAIRGCDAVISTLGVSFTPSTAIDPPPLYTEGTRRIVEAMGRVGIDRIAVISAAFVDQQAGVPSWFRLTVVPALANILEHMRAMERMLEAEQGLKWTAARPGWLIDLPYSGEAQVKARTLSTDCFRCCHADLAALLLDSVVSGRWINEKPAIGKPEADDLEGLLALREELESLFASSSR